MKPTNGQKSLIATMLDSAVSRAGGAGTNVWATFPIPPQSDGVSLLARVYGMNAVPTIMQPFGMLKVSNLVGVGSCNNPGYESSAANICHAPICLHQYDCGRTGFARHMFSVFENKVYDACVGPNYGTKTTSQYFHALVEDQYPSPDYLPGNPESAQPLPSEGMILQ